MQPEDHQERGAQVAHRSQALALTVEVDVADAAGHFRIVVHYAFHIFCCVPCHFAAKEPRHVECMVRLRRKSHPMCARCTRCMVRPV